MGTFSRDYGTSLFLAFSASVQLTKHGLLCSTAWLRSTMPTGNVLKAPELAFLTNMLPGSPHFWGESLGTRLCQHKVIYLPSPGNGTIDCVPKWVLLQVAVTSRAMPSVFWWCNVGQKMALWAASWYRLWAGCWTLPSWTASKIAAVWHSYITITLITYMSH